MGVYVEQTNRISLKNFKNETIVACYVDTSLGLTIALERVIVEEGMEWICYEKLQPFHKRQLNFLI